MKRVVITGIGIISPIGNNKREFWDSLARGRGGVRKIEGFDASSFDSQIAGEVRNFDPERLIKKKELKHMDRFVQFASVATNEAIADCGMNISNEDPERVGVLIGSGIGGLETFERQHSILLEKGPSRVSPFFIPMLIVDMASGQISIDLGAKGPNFCISTACATATHSIGQARMLIQQGKADIMIAGGTEKGVTRMGLAGFCAMKALSTRNSEPARASRPFDKERDGFIIAEGAGILILEELGHALSRDAHIYAEITGFGMSSDAYHISAPAPGGEGAIRSMRQALADSSTTDIDYINAHGTSTPLNDRCETVAIKTVFGSSARNIPVSSTKSMTGHLLGASGGVELASCILALEEGIVHPTINYEHPDPDCDLDYVPNEARNLKVKTAMSNSFGFGGHNATLILEKYEG